MKNYRIGILVVASAALFIAQLSFSQQGGAQSASNSQMSKPQANGDREPAGNPSANQHDLTLKEKMTKIMLTNDSFVKKAAIANRAEIELSKLALDKTRNAQMQKFAQRMVDDHTMASNELKRIASDKKIELPNELDHSHQSTLEKLGKLDGNEFDAAFSKQMGEDHDKVVSLFTAAADDNSLDPQLRNFANKMLPTLRDHQHDAHSLKSGNSKAAAL